MTLNVQFAAPPATIERYKTALTHSFATAGLAIDLRQDHAPNLVDYIIYAPNGPLSDFTPYSRAKAVLSLWAGVEKIVNNPTLRIPLARMVDGGLREGMVEYVTGHTLRHHLGMDAYIKPSNQGWTPVIPPLARNRSVCILGLGELGQACATALAALNFDVTGWSRHAKTIPNIHCLHGETGLHEALRGANIIILLLPLTSATQNLLNAHRLAQTAPGAFVINPGRGALIDDRALEAALNSGQIAHATLDTFRTEPLPADHPFWAQSNVTITPHIASETRPDTAAQVITENIQRLEDGKKLRFLVNRQAGY